MSKGAIAVSLDVSAVPDRPAGAGRYVIELAGALAQTDGIELTLVARRADERWHEVAPTARTLATVPSPRPLRLAYERVALGPRLRGLRGPRLEVHHGPHYTMPSMCGPLARVVTVHDLTFFDHPEWHERAKVPFFRAAIRQAATHADAIVCVSEVTATRLRELLEPRCDIFVAPHGVDLRRFRPEAEESRDDEMLRRFGLRVGARYVLHLGTIEPRKGIAVLVEAFDHLAADDDGLELVLAGAPGWGVDDVDAALRRSASGGRVRRLGWVPDETVPALLRRAAVVAYPSFEEGFGLPALEALACGAPLVTTTGTAMAEVAGEAALTVPAGDAASLAGALRRAIGAGASEQETRRRAGLERCRRFTWAWAAAVHMEAYTAARSAKSRTHRGARPSPG